MKFCRIKFMITCVYCFDKALKLLFCHAEFVNLHVVVFIEGDMLLKKVTKTFDIFCLSVISSLFSLLNEILDCDLFLTG